MGIDIMLGSGPDNTQVPIKATPYGELLVQVRGLKFLGGCLPYSYIAAASANQDSQNIKTTPGILKALLCVCTTATLRYLKIYDKATAPTSADTPVLRLPVPANSTTGAGFSFPLPPEGVAFNYGIAFRMTVNLADSDANAVTANDLVLSAAYQ